MKLEVNIRDTVTPEEVAYEIFNYDMSELDVLISDATARVIDNKDCCVALDEEFNHFDDEKKIKWFVEVLKELIGEFLE